LLVDNTMIAIWANVGTRDALKRAENLLGEVRYPDSISLATLIHGWSRTRFAEAGYRAQELFNQLLQLPPSRQKKSSNITTLCNSVIVAFAKSGESTAPQRAESLLSQLEGRYYSGDTQAAPDKTTFLCVFDTYAKAGIADAEKRCDALLNRMYHIKEVFQLKDLEADRAVYNAILNALAKSQQSSAVEKSEEILTMMETSPDPSLRPDIVTYSTVIDCHTKCGEKSTDRAEEILRYVEGTYRCGDKTLKPNAVFYSAILQCWAKTASVEGAEKAEELLRRNIGLYEQGNDWAKPHTIVFNAVMDAIARSGLEDSGRRADALLQEMESSFQAGDEDLRPSRRSFNAVMMAHRKDGNASKAEAMLYRMEDMAESKGRPEVRPNVVSYNTVIGAIVEDSTCSDNAADRAQALLDRMEAHNVRPDGRSYSPVIEGWLRRNDEKGARVAEAMLSQFLEQVEESKKRKNSDNNYLYEHEVWDVINAYRKTPNRTITSHIF
jgi:Pentatricopeptide repeat domain